MPASVAQSVDPAAADATPDRVPVDPEQDRAPTAPWTLDQLIARAVRFNPRVLAQQAGQAVARAGEAAARWEYFPSPQVQVEGTPQDHQIYTTVTQPLYAFGRLGSGLASARAQGRVAGRRTDEARHDIALRVLDLYGQFASQTRAIGVLDADIARHIALEAMIHRRVEAGVSAPVDLNLVQTRLNQSRIARTTLKARARASLAALSQVMGVALTPDRIRVPGSEPVPAPAAAAAAATDPQPAGADLAGPAPALMIDGHRFLIDEAGSEGLVQRCLDRNPSLQRADAEVAAAQAEARRARAVAFPTIAARFENRNRTSLYPPSGLPDTRLTIGFTIATGAGLATLANVQAADGRIRAALESREALRQDVTTTVISALESFTIARKSVEGLRQSRDVQEQTAESYNRMFLAGKRSWLDVLNMVREQSGIERDLADAEIQLMVADYRLRIEAGDIA